MTASNHILYYDRYFFYKICNVIIGHQFGEIPLLISIKFQLKFHFYITIRNYILFRNLNHYSNIIIVNHKIRVG